MRLGRVSLVLAVPGVTQGKPIDRFCSAFDFEGAAQNRKVKRPAFQ